MTIKKIGIVGVPLGFAAGQTGSELGVNAIRLSKIRGRTFSDHLRSLGFETIDHGDVAIMNPTGKDETGSPKHLAEMLASSNNIMAAVTDSIGAGEIPVIIGGDHSIAIPTFSAGRCRR